MQNTFTDWSRIVEAENDRNAEVIVTWEADDDGYVQIEAVKCDDGTDAAYDVDEFARYLHQANFEFVKETWEMNHDLPMTGNELRDLKWAYKL